jgi:hygromycin-B 4-O-kinase
MDVTLQQVQGFLVSHFDDEVSNVESVGAGAWSTCFGFRSNNQELVVRFGKYVDDFKQDQLAYSYHSTALPIPKVLEIGEAFGGYYAISTRVYGSPLEQLSSQDWLTVVPSLVSALEALRLADISATPGFGGWNGEGKAPRKRWAEHLLAVSDDLPERRTYGWREKLATFPEGEKTFLWGYELLKEVARVSVPRCLIHSDLMNRNVLVAEGNISGVFDWGCGLYGDHLYDLAWFEFWSPWHPELDVVYLRRELEQRWLETGYTPHNLDSRLLACYLHIGLDHLAYNAYLGDQNTLLATAKRMKTLAEKLTNQKKNC